MGGREGKVIVPKVRSERGGGKGGGEFVVANGGNKGLNNSCFPKWRSLLIGQLPSWYSPLPTREKFP